MTEIEALEVAAQNGANAITSFTVYISVTFAFLASIHFVGSSLTRIQTIGITALYLFAAISAAMSQAVYQQVMFRLNQSASSLLEGIFLADPVLWLWGMGAIECLGILASIYYMWSVRHPKSG